MLPDRRGHRQPGSRGASRCRSTLRYTTSATALHDHVRRLDLPPPIARSAAPAWTASTGATPGTASSSNDRLNYFGPSPGVLLAGRSTAPRSAPVTNLSTSVGYVDTNYNLTPYDQPYGVAETAGGGLQPGPDLLHEDERLAVCSGAGTRWRAGSSAARSTCRRASTLGNARTMEVDRRLAVRRRGTTAGCTGRDAARWRSSTSPRWTQVDNGSSGIDWNNVDAHVLDAGPRWTDRRSPSRPADVQRPEPAVEGRLSRQHDAQLAGRPSGAKRTIDCQLRRRAPQRHAARRRPVLDPVHQDVQHRHRGHRLRVTGGSDDGIRIFIDGQPVINDWVDRGFTSSIVETGPWRPATTTIVVEYYENGCDARVLATFEPLVPRSVCTDPVCRGQRRTSTARHCPVHPVLAALRGHDRRRLRRAMRLQAPVSGSTTSRSGGAGRYT